MFYGLGASVLGGALFPTSVLPDWISWANYLVPHSYVIDAGRQLLIANPPDGGLVPPTSTVILFGSAWWDSRSR
jgi:ABC-2 type transport system permease protein